MHVPHVVATPTVLLALLALLCLLTLTSGSHRSQGASEGGGGGRGARKGTADQVSKARRLASAGRGLEADDRMAAEGKEGGGSSELCDNARLQCTVRTGCQMALNNFFMGCNSIIIGEERRCTRACQHALVSLLATEDGAGLAFINCNCSGHALCQERKQRVQVCQRHVLDSMDLVRDEQAAVSCSFARWICEADTSCLAALQYYVQHCSKLFTGTRCTAKCRNSVHILYRQPNAHKLRSCRCEGDEDYDCPSLVANTERLCFQRHRHHHNDSHHHHHQRHDDDQDYVSDGGVYRQPGRRPVATNTQRHTSGQTSLLGPGSSGPPRTAPSRPFRRSKRRNKLSKKKSKALLRKNSSSPSSALSTETKGRRVLKRRAGGRLNKARRTRRRQCRRGRRKVQGRNRRGTNKKGVDRRAKLGGRKRCSLRRSTKQKPRKPRKLTAARRRVARRPRVTPKSSP